MVHPELEIKLTWEWSSAYALRSVVHPFLYACLYFVLELLKLDFLVVMVYGPNLLHAVLFTLA